MSDPTYAALGWRFAVSGASTEVPEWLSALLRPLAASQTEPAATRFSLSGGPRRFDLSLDDVPIGGGPRDRIAAELIGRVRNAAAHAAAPRLAVVHSAAVRRGGLTVLLPGRSGAGKTSLAAGLARAGWSYLGDEIIGLDAATAEAVACPTPLRLGGGALRALGLRDHGDLGVLDDQDKRYVSLDELGVPAPPVVAGPPSDIVFPAYVPGAATRLLPVPRAHALATLMITMFPYDPARGSTLLQRITRRARCWQLSYGDLETAVRCLETPPFRSAEELGSPAAQSGRYAHAVSSIASVAPPPGDRAPRL